MNDMIENKTFDEIQVGDRASLTRALDREGVEALAILTGNLNLIDLDPRVVSLRGGGAVLTTSRGRSVYLYSRWE